MTWKDLFWHKRESNMQRKAEESRVKKERDKAQEQKKAVDQRIEDFIREVKRG